MHQKIVAARFLLYLSTILFVVLLDRSPLVECFRSLGSCPDRHAWAKSINPHRQLVLGALFPGDDLLPSLQPAINLAKLDINRDKCVLTHYDLEVPTSDTGCKASKGMKALFSMMHDKPKKTALFGGACTAVNEPVASAARFWNITQLSYYETHPKFLMGADSHDMYRTFYRIVPGVLNEQMAQISFIKMFGWRRFGMVAQKDDERYNLPHEKYVNTLEQKEQFSIAASTGFSSKKPNYALALSKLKNESARIIIGDFNMTYVGAIFCEAYKQKLTGARHVWILSGQHTRIGSLHEAAKGHCKPEELAEALQGHFVFEFAPIRMDRPTDGFYKDVDLYAKQYRELCDRKRPSCDKENPFHAYAYDGIWALALAIDSAIKHIWQHERRFFDPEHDLEDYGRWSALLASALENNTFEGVTGKVQFDSNNERLGRIQIVQYRHPNYIVVGDYDATTDKLHMHDNDTASLFFYTADKRPPPDAVRKESRLEHIDFSIFCVMCALTSFGILLALCFLAVNVYFRGHRFIKMSSPNMNNLIIAGSILTYVSVVLIGIDTRMADYLTYNVLCTAKVGILSVGFSLAFGSMFSKTWRVHSIFTNIKLNKKAIKDYKLFLLVFALFLIDTIIVSVWIAVSPLHRVEGDLTTETLLDQNLVITRRREYCYSDHMTIFQGLLFGYKGILLILGCFLAWETRHVNVPALNDSKYIGMSVYNVVLMCSLGVAILFILENNQNASFVLISLFIIFCTTLTCCLVFVPKIFELARNPKGTGADRRYRAAMMKSGGTERKLSSEGDQETHREQLVRSQQDNQVWRKMLDDKAAEISELLKRLQEYGDYVAELSSLPKENTSQFSHSSVPDDPFGGVYLGPSGPSFAQKQQEHELEQQQLAEGADQLMQVDGVQQLQADVVQSPNAPKSPALDEVSETTSLLQRPAAGSFRDKLSKLRTSLSRSSMPPTCGNGSGGGVNDHQSNGSSGVDSMPTASVVRTSASMYQSLRELSLNNNYLTDANSNVGGSSSNGGATAGEISLTNYHHHPSTTSTSSDYTDEEDEEDEEASSGTGSSFRRRRRFRYVEPCGSGGESDTGVGGGGSATHLNNASGSSSRTLPSIRESCLSTFNEAISSCESTADDQDQLLGDEDDDEDDSAEEDDSLL